MKPVIALVGRPNVGKSSLMNALARRETAIVTPVPGTTRDLLREQISVEGLPVELIDTAGIRPGADAVEAMGIARARQAMQSASLALLIVDAQAGWTAEEAGLWTELGDLPRVVVCNKADLVADLPPLPPELPAPVPISALRGDGLDHLRQTLAERLGSGPTMASPFSARARHCTALECCAARLDAAGALGDTAPELLAEELRQAADALGEITGRITSEEVLGTIFSRFCIGK